MGVVGTRVPPALGQRVLEHCRGLGKTPSEWLRELVERELAGKTPNPAVGDAVQHLSELVGDNTKLVGTILAVAIGTYKALVQIEMVNHPDRTGQLEQIDRQFRERLLEKMPAKEQLTIETGLRISDLASEIERIRGEKQIQRGLP
ncbi:MAG: hypothetical protein A2Y60_06725 [Chloroflexi bacterium RBG_13_54_9]|nr:MAG: hypothetical protein A2Y60_06725 [Chloroflexi bacterium RBG_13_54_9]